MTHTTEELERMLADATPGPWVAVSGHMQSNGALYWQIENGLDAIMQNQFCYPQGNQDTNAALIAAAPTITAELIAARRKLEAAERMADFVRLVNDSFGGGMVMTFSDKDVTDISEAIAAWEAAQ